MAKILGIHHIALVVPEVEGALAFWRDTLGIPLQEIANFPEQASRIAFLPMESGELELLEPTVPDSGIARFLQKRGPGIHHVCFEVDDLDGMIAVLKERGVRLLSDQPMTGGGGRRMIFIHPESARGVLVELYEAHAEG
jgi:methylmalonyl-CoA/ethylmalonyl-CoA epimerase